MPERLRRSEFLALMAASTATIAIAIDTMLPAFAEVREHFGLAATSSDVALIITVFMAGLGIGQLVYGPLADRFGRKPVFVASLLLYAVAGFITTVAPSLTTILIGRLFWGLGAAGPRVVSQAMLRDRFQGDALARAMAVIMAIFLIAPAVAPILGEAVLLVGSWRWTFAVGPVFALIVVAWSLRLGESLEPSARRPLDFRSVGRGVGEVVRTPSALGNALAMLALMVAFLPYLASSERIFEEIYARGDQFALWFAVGAIVMAGVTLGVSRVVKSWGTARTTGSLLALLLATAALNLAVTLMAEGVPSFAVYFVGTTALVSMSTAVNPLLISRSLEDVGHVAGTAASIIGAMSFIGGSLLSPLIDRSIATTVTPFAVGYLVCAALALGFAVGTDRIRSQSEEPVATLS